MKGRLNNYGNFLTCMSAFEAAGITPGQSTLKEHSIMLSCLMEMEGYDGILPDEPSGSFYNARIKATQQGYFLKPKCPGVRFLGNIMSENGIKELYAPSLVALLGIDSFANMLKVGYDINPLDTNEVRDDYDRKRRKDNRIAIDEIEAKSEEERTDEERKTMDAHEEKKNKKNDNDRKRRKSDNNTFCERQNRKH